MYQDKFNSLLENYPILAADILGSSMSRWLAAVAIFFISYIALKIFKYGFLKKLKNIAKKTKNEFDDVIINGLDAIHWPFNVFIAVYVAQLFLQVNNSVAKFFNVILIITVSYYLIRVAQSTIDVFMSHILQGKQDSKEDVEMIKFISTFIKLGLWLIALLLVLSNVGYNLNSLIAGLGIGGVVVAFAIQKIVADLFSSLSIYFDKPFAVGDFVQIGSDMGTVKHIGLRITRLASLSGEELVIPNSDVTTARIQNFGKMKKRRVAFNIGVTYDTTQDKLKMIPGIISDIIKVQKECVYDRCHFKNFGDFALGFEVVYYIDSGDYVAYLNNQQAINLSIVEHFEKHNIQMAFPTQTIHIKK